MKTNIKTILLAAACMLTMASCDGFLDLAPKGKNTLSSLDDLETLLNDNYAGGWGGFIANLLLITNEAYPYSNTTPAGFVTGSKGLTYGYLTYDETVDRPSLTESDGFYNTTYKKIASYNVLISKIGEVEGDPARKSEMVAEARVLRAYMHWMLVNVYAKAYDPATATSEGGIPYVTDVDFGLKNPKQTVAQVYAKLMEDLDDQVIAQVSETPSSFQRPSRAFAYAVRAKVRLSMRQYADALSDAGKALGYNSTMEDRRPYEVTGLVRVRNAADNYLYMPGSDLLPNSYTVSAEWIQLYEQGDVMRYYTNLYEDASAVKAIPGCYTWKNGTNYQFNSLGIRTEDMVLLKAECLARTGNVQAAMTTLNSLRTLRIKASDYQPLTATTEAQAMAHIIKVSRIEFLFTHNNFFNLKRWNTEDAYQQNITRTIPMADGTHTYTLKPGSSYWIMPFPKNATDNNPSLTQNY